MNNCQDLCTAAKCTELENRIIKLEDDNLQLKIAQDYHRVLIENLTNRVETFENRVETFENNFNTHIKADLTIVHGNYNINQLQDNFNQHITTDIVGVHGKHEFKPKIEVALALLNNNQLKVFVRIDIDSFGSDNAFGLLELDMNCDFSEVINTINVRATLTDTLVLANTAQILFLSDTVSNVRSEVYKISNDIDSIEIFVKDTYKKVEDTHTVVLYNNNILTGLNLILNKMEDAIIDISQRIDAYNENIVDILSGLNLDINSILIYSERINTLTETINTNIQEFYKQQIEYNELLRKLILEVPNEVNSYTKFIVNEQTEYLTNKLDIMQLSIAALGVAVGAIAVELATGISAILAAIAAIAGTLATMGITLAAIEGTLVVIRGALAAIEGTLAAIRGALAGIEGTLAGIEGTLAGIEGTLAGIEGILQSISNAVSEVKTEVSEVKSKVLEVKSKVLEVKTEVLEVKSKVLEVKAALLIDITGEIISVTCQEKPDDFAYDGKGLSGLVSMIKAISELTNRVRKEVCLIEPAAVVPDWWQVRTGQRSQAVVLYQEFDTGTGQFLPSKWSLAIPHYRFGQNAIPDIPQYDKGNIQGMLTLADNSKIIVNCVTIDEAHRVLGILEGLVDPSMLVGADSLIGERKGKALKQCSVKPRSIKFFENGQRNTIPTWTKKIE
jgi:archaellum component FlaC